MGLALDFALNFALNPGDYPFRPSKVHSPDSERGMMILMGSPRVQLHSAIALGILLQTVDQTVCKSIVG
jgi:hypothetical protein